MKLLFRNFHLLIALVLTVLLVRSLWYAFSLLAADAAERHAQPRPSTNSVDDDRPKPHEIVSWHDENSAVTNHGLIYVGRIDEYLLAILRAMAL